MTIANRKLLIVDDDPSQTTIIRRLAERQYFDCKIASTFDSAVEVLQSKRFDSITIDLSLGRRDGVELLRLITDLPEGPNIIFISGHEERILDTAVRMAAAAGISASAVRKPFQPSRLRDLLNNPVAVRKKSAHSMRLSAVDEAMIQRGLARSEFYPLFQPKISLTTGRMIGCEALARWDSTDRGMISPGDFIPVSEANGSIVQITRLMLEKSICAAASLAGSTPGFSVSVNISPLLLCDLSLPEQIEKLLIRYRLPAECLILEVTESTAMLDVIRASDILLRLRIKGIGLSIDDFGTGHSSFSALVRMPFTELKIDQSFVMEYLTDSRFQKIVRGSIALGHEFDLKVVAEGVENAALAASLAELGCDVGQGFHYAPAIPFENLVKLDRRHWMG